LPPFSHPLASRDAVAAGAGTTFMTNRSQPSRLVWIAVLLCALVFVVWTDAVRLRHVEFVSRTADTPASTWRPRLIVPEHNNVAYEWLDQARQMFDRGEWRVRTVDYENAPFGHAVSTPSPYRWWLALLAECDHLATGRPPGACVEFAASIADPLLHVLLLIATALFVTLRFGPFAGATTAAMLATLFPFGFEFLPGMPGDGGLALAVELWSVLALLAGITASRSSEGAAATRFWFIVAGVIGGIGLWIDVAGQFPLLVGVALGGVTAWWVARRSSPDASPVAPPPWRTWALAGALTTLLAYLAEFFPSHLGGWQLRTIHPIYGIAWLGLGELLALLPWPAPAAARRSRLQTIALAILALLAIAAVPLVLWRTHHLGFLEIDLPAMRLTRLRNGEGATNFYAWLLQSGISPAVRATLLPLLLIAPALWLLCRRATALPLRLALALALGPVAVALGFAARELAWWNTVDGLLVALAAIVAAALAELKHRRVARWTFAACGLLLLLPGIARLVPSHEIRTNAALDETEVYSLIERDLARWLALHAGPDGGIVLAPHDQTATFYYFGGLRGVPTFGPDNRDGLGAAVRILSASTPEEAKTLIMQRGITHIVIPSWDTYLDVYARMGMGQLDGTFMKSLDEWKLPPWLRPVPFQLPTIPGFAARSVIILSVVDDQNDAAALSRIAEYFIEMGQLDRAGAVAQALRRFPADIGAIVARAQFEDVSGDAAEFGRLLDLIRPFLAAKADRRLPWDRRVALAVVLTRGKDTDLAREQVRRCVATIDETKIRSLPTGSLYRLLALSRAFGIPISDTKLRDLALALLPPDLRSHL
jgi:hypothetical protein